MSSSNLIAVVDACVLCGTLKRHLMLGLAEAGFFRVHWSDKILDETEKAITIILTKRAHAAATEHAALARELIGQSFQDATVTNYEQIGKGIQYLPDEGDRHVVAAALKCKADVIVTENLKDFPRKVLAKYSIEARSSDEFLADMIALDPPLAVAAVKRMRSRLNRPDKTADLLLLDIQKAGLKKVALQLRDFAAHI